MAKQLATIKDGLVTDKIVIPDEWTDREWGAHLPEGATGVEHEASMVGDAFDGEKFTRKIVWNGADGNPIPDFEIDVDNPPEEVLPRVPTADEIDTKTLNALLVQEGSAVRALTLVMLEELNRHAEKITAILDAADNASNLAGFKTAMALITDSPQRTVDQLKTALKAKMRD